MQRRADFRRHWKKEERKNIKLDTLATSTKVHSTLRPQTSNRGISISSEEEETQSTRINTESCAVSSNIYYICLELSSIKATLFILT